MPILIHFLLVFSHAEQRLIDKQQFVDVNEAAEAYRAAEERYRGHSDEFEVVLVGADSIETIEKTHGHYFLAAGAPVGFGDLVSQ